MQKARQEGGSKKDGGDGCIVGHGVRIRRIDIH